MTPKLIARQLSHPSGLLGRAITFLMNRHNAKMNAFAVRQLELSPADRVLEVGFGGGPNLPALMEQARRVAGVDRSADVVKRMAALYSEAVISGRADFRQGTMESLPCETASFDRVLTVNTVYFWKSLEAGFAEIHRVLAPGGRVVVGFEPKEAMQRRGFPPDIFTLRTVEEVSAALAAAGFTGIREARPRPQTTWCAIAAVRA